MEQRIENYAEQVEEIINEFCTYMITEKKLADSTIHKYENIVKQFCITCLTYDININAEDIVTFFGELYIQNVNCTHKNNIKSYEAGIKKFIEFLYKTSKIEYSSYKELNAVLIKKEQFFTKIKEGEKFNFSNSMVRNKYLLEKYMQVEEQWEEFSIDIFLLNSMNNISHSQFNIVRDFNFFLKYIDKNKVKLNYNKGYLSKKHLEALSEGFISKESYKKTMKQEQLLLVRFFYHASLNLQLCRVDKGNIFVTTRRKNKYTALSIEAQYCLLLDTLWNSISWETLLEENYSGRPNISQNIRSLYARVLLGFPIEEEIKIESEKGQNFISFSFSWNLDVFQTTIIPLLKYFEILEYKYRENRDEEEKEDGIGIESILIKKVGHEILSVYAGQSVKMYTVEPIEAKFYAVIMKRFSTRKIGRNEPCPCGSTRKYKKCCKERLQIS